MTRLLKTTACALVSSALLLLPAAEAHGHLHNHSNNDNAAAAAGAHDAHHHHHGDKHRSFRVREVRFSPFTVHDSTELVRAFRLDVCSICAFLWCLGMGVVDV